MEVGDYRPVSLTSLVVQQMEHGIARYLRQVWEMSRWLYEGQHGFKPGYSRESQVSLFVRISRTHWRRESEQTR